MLFSMCFSTLGAQVNKTEKSGHGHYLSGCPPPYYHYPHEENNDKTCAYYWNEEGDDWPVDACNGIRASAGWVILIHPVLISPWVQFMYSLAAQCICMKIQILREPGRNFMRDLFQTINIFQVVVVPQDLNHSNADVITQLIVFQKMAMKLFFNMTTKRAKHPSH